MNKFSNILKIPASFDLYKEMANKIALKIKSIDPSSDVPMFGVSERRLEDVMILESTTNFAVEAIYDQSKYSVKTLNELTDSDQIFVLHLNVLQINPQTIYEYVCLLCSSCNMR
jgi:hypothetical protein